MTPPIGTMPGRPAGRRAAEAPLSVLVVEDRPDAAESLAALRLDGHEVRVAHDGPSALEQAGRSPPDAVLLDIGLPGVDGWHVAERLRATAGERRPLLVAVTGYGGRADRDRSERAGIDLHLAKPADPGVLLEMLRRFGQILRPPPETGGGPRGRP
jgi:CheY-like chemotaxis protein